MRNRLVLFTLAATALCAPAAAAPEYFDAAAFDFRAVVAAPPADDSVAGRADRDMAVLFDANRTPDQVALAKRYEKFNVFVMLAQVLGPGCTPENLPRTRAFFMQAYAEGRPVVDAAKEAWNRTRPYVRNPALNPVVERPANASYPSGHASSSSFYAVLLAAALPELAADWERQSRLVGWSRLYGGAHYPTDVVAGWTLGEAVAREMLKSPLVRKALDEVRAELAPLLARKAA